MKLNEIYVKQKNPSAIAKATLRVGVYRFGSHPDTFWQRKNRSQAAINGVKAVSTSAGGGIFHYRYREPCIATQVGIHRCPILLAGKHIVPDCKTAYAVCSCLKTPKQSLTRA